MSTAKKKDLNSLGDIYGDMLNGIKRTIVKESKVKEGEIGEAPLLKGGPDEKGGFVPSKIDRNKLSKKELEDNLYNIKDLSYSAGGDDEEDEEEIPQESRKIARESLNNFMSKKSIFDRLYENVIGQEEPMGDTAELDALGIEGGEDEGGDEVTFTLDRETAQKLHDVLMTVLGGDEGEGEDEMETETETEEDYEYSMEDEDEEELGHAGVNAKEPDMGKNNKVGNLKPQSGGAVSKYTDKVGNDGDYGHALVNAKQPNMGKSNKVGSLKPGKSLFEQ